MIVVLSWDDGHPADMKVAELLDRHEFSGTFFVPVKNSEGRPVMSNSDLRELDTRFEIGSHTYSHIRLNTIPPSRIESEIVSGMAGLEDIVGHSVRGFCYPGGEVNRHAVECLQQRSALYARTIENFRLDGGDDSLHLPTTLQFFQHSNSVYFKNLVKRGSPRKRMYCFWRALSNHSVWDAMEEIAADRQDSTDILHFWGHSWEIEEHGLWEDLDGFLERLGRLAPVSQTVSQCVAAARGTARHIGS